MKQKKSLKLSKYQFKKLAKESLINSLRLHIDSIILYEHQSYPSAYQLSVLALEELSKAKWIDHYYYTSITNNNFADVDFEQEWLNLLYFHTKKQFAFIAQEIMDYSPKFIKFIKEGKLENKKQQSIYVGFKKNKKRIDTNSRISIPNKKIKLDDAKQIISLMNDSFLYIYSTIEKYDTYWGICELDQIINQETSQILFCWPFKSALKSLK